MTVAAMSTIYNIPDNLIIYYMLAKRELVACKVGMERALYIFAGIICMEINAQPKYIKSWKKI